MRPWFAPIFIFRFVKNSGISAACWNSSLGIIDCFDCLQGKQRLVSDMWNFSFAFRRSVAISQSDWVILNKAQFFSIRYLHQYHWCLRNPENPNYKPQERWAQRLRDIPESMIRVQSQSTLRRRRLVKQIYSGRSARGATTPTPTRIFNLPERLSPSSFDWANRRLRPVSNISLDEQSADLLQPQHESSWRGSSWKGKDRLYSLALIPIQFLLLHCLL